MKLNYLCDIKEFWVKWLWYILLFVWFLFFMFLVNWIFKFDGDVRLWVGFVFVEFKFYNEYLKEEV